LSDAIIIDLKDHTPSVEFPATRKPTVRPRWCLHSFVIDEKERTVHCKRCDADIDPFDAILYLAKRWDRVREATEHYASEQKRLEVSVADLQRQERNTKARLKRAKAKLG
jgi:hypothetical protein